MAITLASSSIQPSITYDSIWMNGITLNNIPISGSTLSGSMTQAAFNLSQYSSATGQRGNPKWFYVNNVSASTLMLFNAFIQNQFNSGSWSF